MRFLDLNDKLAILNYVAKTCVIVEWGTWMCSQEKVIARIDRKLSLHKSKAASADEAVNRYFDIVTSPGASLYRLEDGEEYQYDQDRQAFVHVGGYIAI
jgi:hypothetical protein